MFIPMMKINVTDIPADPAARREWIKFQLRLRGWSLSRLSRAYGGSRYCAVQALRKRYPKWERIIARELGLPPEALWPERYGESDRVNGKPKSVAAQRKNTQAA